MFRGLPEGLPEEAKKMIFDSSSKFITESGPLKRWGKVEELVPTYLLLADNNASSFTIGSCWVLDGGVTYYGTEMKVDLKH